MVRTLTVVLRVLLVKRGSPGATRNMMQYRDPLLRVDAGMDTFTVLKQSVHYIVDWNRIHVCYI